MNFFIWFPQVFWLHYICIMLLALCLLSTQCVINQFLFWLMYLRYLLSVCMYIYIRKGKIAHHLTNLGVVDFKEGVFFRPCVRPHLPTANLFFQSHNKFPNIRATFWLLSHCFHPESLFIPFWFVVYNGDTEGRLAFHKYRLGLFTFFSVLLYLWE